MDAKSSASSGAPDVTPDGTSEFPSVTTTPGEGIDLCAEQKEAVQRIMTTDKPVVILTGEAGSGKSTVVNHLRNQVDALVCATTGKAATHVEGVTVDAAFCIGREDWKVWSPSYQEYIMRNCPDLIIIDEASMMGKNMGNLVEEARALFRKKILLVGDWAQARPVKEDWLIYSRLLKDFEFIKLKENHRQEQGSYMDALRSLRAGEITPAVNQIFSQRVMSTPPDDDSFIRMYAINKKTDAYNNARLFRLVHENNLSFFRVFAEFQDLRQPSKQQESPRSEGFKQNAIESSRLGHGVPLAIGGRVVFTINDTAGNSRQYVNGDTGVLVDGMTADGRPLTKALSDLARKERPFQLWRLDIKLDRTGQVIQVQRMRKISKDPLEREIHSVSGFPLQLGYALTIHKAQGMTVRKAWVDLPSLMCFPDDKSRHGLAYVALSRTRTIDGLYVSAWCPQAVHCDPEIHSLI